MKIVILFAVLCLTTITVQAADNYTYMFGSTGYNFTKLESHNKTSTIHNAQAAGAIWEIGAGYRFNPHLAAELSYANFGKTKATTSSLGNTAISMGTTAGRVAILGIIPVAQNFEVFGKLSLNRVRTVVQTGNSQKSKDTRLGFGLGAQYQLTENLALRGEYEYIKGGRLQSKAHQPEYKTANASMLKIGINYQF